MMRKLLLILLVAILSLPAYAGGAQRTRTRTSKNTKKVANATFATKDYNRVYFSYSPDLGCVERLAAYPTTVHGFETGYARGFKLSKRYPLFLEAGANIKFNQTTRTWTEEDKGEYFKTRNTLSLLSINIPVNLTYRFKISKDFALVPYFGVRFCFNPMLRTSVTSIYEREPSETYNENISTNVFQFGMQGGLGAVYKSYYFAFGGFGNFGTIDKPSDGLHNGQMSVQGINLTIGYEF